MKTYTKNILLGILTDPVCIIGAIALMAALVVESVTPELVEPFGWRRFIWRTPEAFDVMLFLAIVVVLPLYMFRKGITAKGPGFLSEYEWQCIDNITESQFSWFWKRALVINGIGVSAETVVWQWGYFIATYLVCRLVLPDSMSLAIASIGVNSVFVARHPYNFFIMVSGAFLFQWATLTFGLPAGFLVHFAANIATDIARYIRWQRWEQHKRR